MSARPHLATMWNLAFDDETLRLLPYVRGQVAAEFRCDRRAHLQAVVFRGAFGSWAAYRSIRGARDVWGQVWLDELAGPVEVTCHCDDVRRVDLRAEPPRNRRWTSADMSADPPA